MHICQNDKMLEFLSRCKTRSVAPLRGSTVSRNFTKITFFRENPILERAASSEQATLDFQRDACLVFFLLGMQSSSRGMSIGMIEIFPGAKYGLDVNWNSEKGKI